MLDVATESKSFEFLSLFTMLLYLLMDELTILGSGDLRNHSSFLGISKPIVHQFITYSKIVEWHDEVVDDSVTQPKFVWYVVAKQLYNILVVHSILCGSKPE